MSSKLNQKTQNKLSSKPSRSRINRNKLKITPKKKGPFQPQHLSEGTILYSACDYNGIVLEYQLAQKTRDLYELLLFFRVMDKKSDYILGITLDHHPDQVQQLLFNHQTREVVNRVPLLRSENIVLIDGVLEVLNQSQYSALRLLIKTTKKIQQIDFWVSEKDCQLPHNLSESQILTLPGVTDYRPPKSPYRIEEAYPQFPADNWWKEPIPHHQESLLNKPSINWDSGYLIEEKEEIPLDSIQLPSTPENITLLTGIDSSHQSEDQRSAALQGLSDNLELLNLQESATLTFQPESLNYCLVLENTNDDKSILITILSQYQAYPLTVPPKSNLNHLIDSLGPVQVYLGNLNLNHQRASENLIIEDLNRAISLDFVETLEGVWLYWENSLPNNPISCQLEIYHHGEFWKEHRLQFEKSSQNKNFLPLVEYGVYLIRIFLLRPDGRRKIISQYEYSKLKPRISMSQINQSDMFQIDAQSPQIDIELTSKNVEPTPISPAPKDIEPLPSSPASKDIEQVPSSPASKDIEQVPSSPAPKEVESVPSSPAPKEVESVPSSPASKDIEQVPSSPAPKEVESVPSSPAPKDIEPLPSSPASKDIEPLPSSPAPKEVEPVPSSPAPKEVEPVPSSPVPKEANPVLEENKPKLTFKKKADTLSENRKKLIIKPRKTLTLTKKNETGVST